MVEEKTQEEKKKDYELASRTLDAMLLGFETPIKYDKTIPYMDIPRSFLYALQKLHGNETRGFTFFQESKDNSAEIGFVPEFLDEKILEIDGIEPRVKKGLTLLMKGYLDILLLAKEDMLSKEWFAGYGDLVSFRTGQREKAQSEVKSFFNEKELTDIKLFYSHLNDYVAKKFEIRR